MSIQTAGKADRRASNPLRDIVESELRWASELCDVDVTAGIEDRHVVLAGLVDWKYQRDAAEQLVRSIPGVDSLENQIDIAVRTPLRNAEERLRNARFRDPQIETRHISVTVCGKTAVLTGQVKSLAEKRQAGLAAWICPGVTEVDNRLDVRPTEGWRGSRP